MLVKGFRTRSTANMECSEGLKSLSERERCYPNGLQKFPNECSRTGRTPCFSFRQGCDMTNSKKSASQKGCKALAPRQKPYINEKTRKEIAVC